MIQYFVRIAAWLSQGLNCIAFIGHHDQTVSARIYINRARYCWLYNLINAIFFWQEDHCKESYEADVEFATQLLKGEPL